MHQEYDDLRLLGKCAKFPEMRYLPSVINYQKHTLDNGLRVILHRDPTTPLVALNMLYEVGSKNESPERTGFAHLFEHLMFGGSSGAPSFDDPIQLAGGECNAFTNSDLTNFFAILPAPNLELALFLEADRMENLILNERSLGVQRNVVTEEFMETCLNQPYGDMWHMLAPLAYTEHPYKWPTIGREIEHISGATLDDVRSFYSRYYVPDNAICALSGNFEPKQALRLIEKYFGKMTPGRIEHMNGWKEPEQHTQRRKVHSAGVPVDSIYMAFHMCGRAEKEYYATDLLSDILASGHSSRLYRELVKERQICSEVDAYITGTAEPGLLIIEAKPSEEESLEEIEAAIWEVLADIKDNPVVNRELEKHQNKIESSVRFSNTSILNKAMNLAYFDMIGDTELINTEHVEYVEVTPQDIQQAANAVFRAENCSVLEYRRK